MKTIKTIFLVITLILISKNQLLAQVQGINYTISPTADYIWWDQKSGLSDGFLLGGKLGFGFGEFLELRGSYAQAIQMKTSFSDYGFSGYNDSLYSPQNVDVVRWGGELKANIGRGHLLPFLTLGTGIQSIKPDLLDKTNQIFLTLGAGIKLSAGDRYTLTLEGKNTSFNYNAGKYLLTQEDKASMGVSDNQLELNNLTKNWVLGASLQFYLGGRKPGQLSELDKTYLRTFSGGLAGMQIPLEANLSYIKWYENLPYRDTWMGGGYAGLDFGDYVGVRGFYLHSMSDGSINLQFDDLSMYGGELRTRLNVARGVTPYLMLGGGYIDVGDQYVSKNPNVSAESQAFALGGVGLFMPVGKRLKVFGGARALITSGTLVSDIQNTDQLATSWSYGLGLNVSIGKKSKAASAVFQSEMDNALYQQQLAYNTSIEQLQLDYQARYEELESKLVEAYQKNEPAKVDSIITQQDELVRQFQEKNRIFAAPNQSQIQLSPAEFQNIISEILDKALMREWDYARARVVEAPETGVGTQNYLQQQELDRQISEVEKLLIQMNERQLAASQNQQGMKSSELELVRTEIQIMSERLMNLMEQINNKVDQNSQDIKSLKENKDVLKDSDLQKKGANEIDKSETEVPIKEAYIPVTDGEVLDISAGGKFIEDEDGFRTILNYEGVSGFAGFNLGGQFTFNTGFRWHYGIGSTDFELMPEAFFGFGKPSAFGLTINGIYPVTLRNIPLTPYLGVGTGFMQIAQNGDDKLRLNYNFIFGTYLNILGGRLYVDFTARNRFKFNQIIAGYRFNF